MGRAGAGVELIPARGGPSRPGARARNGPACPRAHARRPDVAPGQHLRVSLLLSLPPSLCLCLCTSVVPRKPRPSLGPHVRSATRTLQDGGASLTPSLRCTFTLNDLDAHGGGTVAMAGSVPMSLPTSPPCASPDTVSWGAQHWQRRRYHFIHDTPPHTNTPMSRVMMTMCHHPLSLLQDGPAVHMSLSAAVWIILNTVCTVTGLATANF